jgi:hypothetical protein
MPLTYVPTDESTFSRYRVEIVSNVHTYSIVVQFGVVPTIYWNQKSVLDLSFKKSVLKYNFENPLV